MATKPSGDVTFTWATDVNFSSGPAAGNPTKVNPAGWTVVAQGAIPGNGIVAEFTNKVRNVLGQWTGWLDAGSGVGDNAAHILEVDAEGDTNVRAIGYTRRIDNSMIRVAISVANVEIRASATPNQGSEFLVDITGLTGTRILTVNNDGADPPRDGEQVWLTFNAHATQQVDLYSDGGSANPIFTTTNNVAQAVKLLFDDTLNGGSGEWIVAGVLPLI